MKTKVELRLPMRLAGIVRPCLALFYRFPCHVLCDDKYGAMAYSKKTGRYGRSYNFDTQVDEEGRALDECGKYGSGREVVQWFRNACGALAGASNRAHGHAWASSLEGAADQAPEWRRGYGGHDCALRCSP